MITCIFIDKYLGGGWSALALVLLSVAYVLFGMKCYHLHEGYLASLRRWWGSWSAGHDCFDIDLDYCGIVAGVFFLSGWVSMELKSSALTNSLGLVTLTK